jgi:hypothetical protein
MILKAKNIGLFDKYVHHFLLHPEIFEDNKDAKGSLRYLQSTIQELLKDDDLPQGCSISFKWDDTGCLEHSSEDGPKTRQNLAYLLQEISQLVQNTGEQKKFDDDNTEIAEGSLLILQNVGLGWVLGPLDAGVDIITTRISGRNIIERPIRGGIRGKRDVPAPWDHSKLAEGSLNSFKLRWNTNSAFSTPPGIAPEPYWNGLYGERLRYVCKLKAASAIALSEEYSKALLNEEIPLKDALLNRIKQSDVKQELMDLCPSLW